MLCPSSSTVISAVVCTLAFEFYVFDAQLHVSGLFSSCSDNFCTGIRRTPDMSLGVSCS